MFAVPGWSVSADALRTQTQLTAKLSREAAPKVLNGTSGEETKSSKKRKRGSTQNHNATVTSSNFAELWQKHIEHRAPTKSTNDRPLDRGQKRNKGRKGLKGENEVSAGGDGEGKEDGAKVDGEGQYLKRKTLKEKKREKKAQMQANGEVLPSRSNTIENPEASRVQGSPGNFASFPEEPPNMIDKNMIVAPPPASKLTPLQSSMRQKLISARFRHLNQTLYNTPSISSFELFQQNPTFFNEYHEGFQRQVEAWPENPIEGFIQWIEERAPVGLGGKDLKSQKFMFKKNKRGQKAPPSITEPPQDSNIPPLPRHPSTHLSTIADLGCGTAILSRTLSPLTKTLNIKINSYDLCASDPCVTVADIRSIPLPDSSVDITIFCLALMGTNWLEFVEEAWRILRWKGECWIGEVVSRFVSPSAIKAERVAHSVGNRRKGEGKKNEKKKKADEDLPDDDEMELANESTSIAPPIAGSLQTTSDLTPFISVLRTRGFVLASEPELGNKMFVRMRFVKGLTPTRGKCVPIVKNEQEGKKPKFLEKIKISEDLGPEEEGRVLKGCVYKNR